MASLNLNEHPHRRFNRLSRERVLVSPNRTQRPWQGQVEKTAEESQPVYDPACYMCPGNQRAVGVRNPVYETTFIFDNDFPALLPDTPPGNLLERDLLVARSGSGICRVAGEGDSNAVPFPRPLLLLGDARTLLRKRKLCPKKLCHPRGSPQAFGPTSVQFEGLVAPRGSA
jgi:galactose-1-phosphate uridylyltransferase (family 1)